MGKSQPRIEPIEVIESLDALVNMIGPSEVFEGFVWRYAETMRQRV